jgi:hypothetical protein
LISYTLGVEVTDHDGRKVENHIPTRRCLSHIPLLNNTTTTGRHSNRPPR